jgi:putative mRNA 3-end processing factor
MRVWVDRNREEGYSSVFQAYSLGKAQRLISAFREFEGSLFAHGAVLNMQSALNSDGWDFPIVERMNGDVPEERRKGCVFITPAPVENSRVRKMIGPYRTAVCSGWMQIRGNKRRGAADAGFALSDHADWDGLLSAVHATGAERVFATHGFQSAFSRYLSETGIEAHEVQTAYGGEETEDGEEEAASETTPPQT